MARPKRCRRICSEPEYAVFSPDAKVDASILRLSLDEYEALRLVDYEKQTHEQAAQQMDISRTTVTEIYESARYKMACALVEGRRLVIDGGNYRLCQEEHPGCHRQCHRDPNVTDRAEKHGTDMRGVKHTMKIAVTYENGQVFQHFGKTEQFKVYNVEMGEVKSCAIVDTDGNGHGALAGFLQDLQVEILICGGIGGGAQAALSQAGIRFYGGVSGSADEAVEELLAGTLVFDPLVRCDDKKEGEGHHCGGHHHEGQFCENHFKRHGNEAGHPCGGNQQ